MTAASSAQPRPWLLTVRSEIADRNLPTPDPEWLLRCRNAGLTVLQAVEAHEDRTQGRAGKHARHHLTIPKRYEGHGTHRTAIVECSCGAQAEASNFSRSEESAWRAAHLEQAGQGTPPT